MPRLFQKSKKLKKQKTGRNSQSQSPPVSSVGTQSEPLPLSYHLDSLLNSESPSPQASRRSYGGLDEVDGTVGQLSPEEIWRPKELSGRPPPSPSPHPARHSAHGLPESNRSWREEERGLGYSGRWPGHREVWSPSGSSQSLKEQTYYLPPPLIPSPPLTLTPSPPPPSYSQSHHTVSQVTMSRPITTPTQLPMTPPTYQHHSATAAPCPANCSLSPPSPFHDTATPLTPSIDIVKKSSSTPNTVLQTTPPPKRNVPPEISGSVSESAVVAWNSTLVELGAVLDQRNKEGTQGQGKIAHKVDVPCSYRGLKKWQCKGGDSEDMEEERREEDEIQQCHMALGALQERESRLIDEIAQLQANLRTESCEEEEVDVPIKGSPHPEVVVADLQETLRQTEQAVQAVQGERDELREGMGRMQEELQSLRRSNSLLAKRKQQWMDVASQVKVVLEENQSLISQYKSQQRAISELRTQYHSRVSALEREMSQMEQDKRAVEVQLNQMKDDQTHLIHQISGLVGISVEEVPQSPDTMRNVTIQLERHEKIRNGEMAAQQERTACLEKENRSLTVRVTEAKAVIRRLEGEMAEVRSVVREGEEAVARLRSQLEEVQDREEATQLQLAHAIAQADKAMAERDTYARIAKRWQCVHSSGHSGQDDESSRALDEARHQLQKREQEHRSQRRRYKTEIHRLRALLASMEERENKRHKTPRKERH